MLGMCRKLRKGRVLRKGGMARMLRMLRKVSISIISHTIC